MFFFFLNFFLSPNITFTFSNFLSCTYNKRMIVFVQFNWMLVIMMLMMMMVVNNGNNNNVVTAAGELLKLKQTIQSALTVLDNNNNKLASTSTTNKPSLFDDCTSGPCTFQVSGKGVFYVASMWTSYCHVKHNVDLGMCYGGTQVNLNYGEMPDGTQGIPFSGDCGGCDFNVNGDIYHVVDSRVCWYNTQTLLSTCGDGGTSYNDHYFDIWPTSILGPQLNGFPSTYPRCGCDFGVLNNGGWYDLYRTYDGDDGCHYPDVSTLIKCGNGNWELHKFPTMPSGLVIDGAECRKPDCKRHMLEGTNGVWNGRNWDLYYSDGEDESKSNICYFTNGNFVDTCGGGSVWEHDNRRKFSHGMPWTHTTNGYLDYGNGNCRLSFGDGSGVTPEINCYCKGSDFERVVTNSNC
jgi:hypothetical protein